MLILTRRIGESLMIGDDESISIKLLDIKGNQARIGITAPKSVPIVREEISKRARKSNQVEAAEC